MAGQWLDDFQGYGVDTAKLLNGVYAQASALTLTADPDPTAGGNNVLRGAAAYLRKVLSSAQTIVGVAARYWPQTLASDWQIAQFGDANNLTHIYIVCDVSGFVKAYRNDTASQVLVASSLTPVIVANAWQHLETKVVLDIAAGSIEVRREGVPVLTVAAIRTTSDRVGAIASIINVVMFNVGANPFGYLKDFAIWDGSGARNNNFLGSRVVKRLRPNADVVFPWTPSSGVTGWNRINTDAPPDDGSYIYASAPLPTPTNGALSATVSGALGAATYYVRSTWVNSTGETLAAAETNLAVAANNVLNVAAPAAPPAGATGWNVYVSTAAGTETKQNGGVPIGIAASWVEPNTGLVAGAALPGANTTAIPAASRFSLEDLPVTVTSVAFVIPSHRSRKTDGGDGNIQVGLKSGGVTGLGADRPMTTAYTYYGDVFDSDPNGGGVWTVAAVNALELQLNRTL